MQVGYVMKKVHTHTDMQIWMGCHKQALNQTGMNSVVRGHVWKRDVLS